MKKLTRLLLLIIPFLFSCETNDEPQLFPSGSGFFILNEGNYLAGNGSLSFYSYETTEIYNNIFTEKNQRALGDIPSFIAIDGNKGYIVVNNSGTIEVVNMLTMESLATITGLNSPRQMVIRGRKGYVSSLYSNEVTVIDLDTKEISGDFNIDCTSEAMVISGSKLFSANWSGGNSIIVTDLEAEQEITTITVGLEPESMVLDKNNKLWVLCTGGWNGEEVPSIVKINAETYGKESELFFRTVNDNPSSLTLNTAGDTLYYLDEGIRMMPVTATSLPSEPFIDSGDRLFYKLVVGPAGHICVTDAIDYQQKGDFLVYNKSGELQDTEQAGIIPGFMLFMPD
jgi:DNA-binding beta-propeller fold protein YncE